MKRLGARLRRDEEGAVLILALAFLLLFSLIVLALLGFTDTSMITTNAALSQHNIVYTADGAIDGAILNGFTSFKSAVSGGTIGSWSCPTFTLPAVNQIASASTVACTVQSTQISTDTNPRPSWAVLTLGGTLSLRNKGTMGVSGDPTCTNTANNTPCGAVFSGSTINAGGGASLKAVNNVRAIGNCKGTITSSTSKVCKLGSGAITDPRYTPALTTAPTTYLAQANVSGATVSNPATANAAITSCSSKLVIITPGGSGLLMANATGLTNLTNQRISTCKGAVLWFKPGVYYFKFANSGSHKWTMGDSRMSIVGGAAAAGTTWSGNPGVKPLIPGACDRTAAGAQFIFGGDSTMLVNNGALEICPTTPASAQRISLFGVGSTSGLTGYTSGTGTVFTSAAKGVLGFAGTVYAPLQTVSIDSTNAKAPVLSRGIIAKSLTFKSPRTAGTIALLPPQTVPLADIAVVVNMTANVAGNTSVNASVTYTSHVDFSGSVVQAYTVNSWAVTRG